jgi:hypothetical protein
MRLTVMCHRPRTQRLGVDSMPREIELVTTGEESASQIIALLRLRYQQMIKSGYPWPFEKIYGFRALPNDRFYLKVVELESDVVR